MKKIALFAIFLFYCAIAHAGTVFNPYTGKFDMCSTVEETDGSPSAVSCQKIKVSNGSLTDNGDGTFSLSTGGGGGTPGGADTQIQYNNAGAFGASAALTFAGNKLQVARTAVAASPADSAIYSVYAYPMATNDIAAGYYSILSNTGTNAAGTGHGIAYLGNAGDAVGSLFPMYGIEGRATVLGQAPLYIGALGLTAWQGTTPATNSILAGVQGRVEITTDGNPANPNTTGTNVTATQFYAPAVIGGVNKYSFFGSDPIRTNSSIYAYDSGGTNYIRYYHDGTDGYLQANAGHISLNPQATKYVIVGSGLGLIPLTEGIALGGSGFRWALNATTGNFSGAITGSGSGITGLPLTTGVTGVLPVANGGTNASSASITAFNNITGYTASGATGTTSTNLVFSASPTISGTAAFSGTISLNSGGITISQNTITSQSGVTGGNNYASTNNSLTTGYIYQGAANTSLSSGGIYTGSSSGASFTGNLLNLNYTGASSGRVANFTSTNASASGNVVRIYNLGTGHSLFIEDETTVDATPFVVTAAGDVGVGNNAPASRLVVSPPAAEAVTAGMTITANACGTIKQINSTGDQTTSTTDTFTAPAAANTGCCMDVINMDTADTITLDFNGKFLSNGGVDVALGPNDTARVCSNGTSWFQIGATGNN